MASDERQPRYLDHSREPTPEETKQLAALDAAIADGDFATIGPAYVADQRTRLDASSGGWDMESPVGSWLFAAFFNGTDPATEEPLPPVVLYRLIVEAADAIPEGDPTMAWLLGEQSANLCVFDHGEAAAWFHAAREDHPGVRRMFDAIEQHDCSDPTCQPADWWSDPTAAPTRAEADTVERTPDYIVCSRTPTAWESWVLDYLNRALTEHDAAAIGAAYTKLLRQDLAVERQIFEAQMRTLRGEPPPTAEVSLAQRSQDDPIQTWLFMLLRDGEHPDTGQPLDARFWFELVVAAAEATQSEGEAWCIGDGPADLCVGDHPEATDWFHEARVSRPGVDRMFRAMQSDYELMGLHAGWWTDRRGLTPQSG